MEKPFQNRRGELKWNQSSAHGQSLHYHTLKHLELLFIYCIALLGVVTLSSLFKFLSKVQKIVIGTATLVLTLAGILLPTKEVLIAMYIANHATPENIQMLINTFIK